LTEPAGGISGEYDNENTDQVKFLDTNSMTFFPFFHVGKSNCISEKGT
jgi:hypothetical protein